MIRKLDRRLICFWSGALAAIAGAIVVGQARAQTAVPSTAPSQNYGGKVQNQAASLTFPDPADGSPHVARPGDPFPITCVSGCSGLGSGVGAAGSPSTSVGTVQGIAGGTPVTVSGTVNVSGGGAVTVSNFPATQPISGSVSIANFPATQPVSGAVSVSGGVSVSNFPATQPVSGAVSVSGGVSVSNFPGTQAVSGSVAVSNQPSGYALAANQPVINGDLGAQVHVMNGPSGYALEGGNLAASKADLDLLVAAINGATPSGPNFTGFTDLQQGGNNLIITAAGAAKVDGSGVTQPISASALPLAAGAATSALQPAINGDLGSQVHVMNFPATPTNYATAQVSAPINISTAVTTQLITFSGANRTYITHWDVVAGGTGNLTLEYGLGSLCGTGTVALTGPYSLTAQSGLGSGNGGYPIFAPIPASNNVCVVTSAAVQMSGVILASQQP